MSSGPSAAPMLTPEGFFAGSQLGVAVYERVLAVLREVGPVQVRVSKTQVAFRRRRGFAYLWLPERVLGQRAAGIVVLSFALGRADDSPRLKQVVRVAPTHWMHHVEVREVDDVDDEVADWLVEAAAAAA